MEKLQLIALSSLARRTENTDTLKLLIKSTEAKLSRKGRSRNWILEASNQQISDICRLIREAGEPSWFWITKSIGEQRPLTEYSELLYLLRSKKAQTVQELMVLTNCSVIDARKAFDDIEWEE